MRRWRPMEAILNQNRDECKTVGSRITPPLPGLKKYTYVLPSGRIMKVVVDDEGEIAANTA
jgi:hypothetical protein